MLQQSKDHPMNCCGKKRQAMTSMPSALATVTSEPEAEGSSLSAVQNASPTTGVFRYTGSSSLEVEGLFGRRVYRFSKETPELVIVPGDAAIMRGYHELIELK